MNLQTGSRRDHGGTDASGHLSGKNLEELRMYTARPGNTRKFWILG